MEDSENEGKPLFLVTSLRIYRPDETPADVQEKACEHESRHLEPEILTDRMVGSFEDEFTAHGLSRRTEGRDSRGPFWTLDCQGAGVGIALDVDDLPKYCAARKIESPHVQALADSGDLTIRSKAGGRDGCRTEDDSDDTFRDSDPPELVALAERIRADWRDYLAGLARRMHADLSTDRDYLTSWECVKESAEANECGFAPDGSMVALSEGRTEGSGYNVGDV